MDWSYFGYLFAVGVVAYIFLKLNARAFEKQIKQMTVERTVMAMTINATADMLTKYIEKYGFEIMEEQKGQNMKQMIKAFQKELAKKKQTEQKA